jgi:2-polyprenyl-6-methoxyphenol hydroxylase-like FAD-dependent oxidoreductase
MPGYSPFPQRDLGWDFFSVSRPMNEFTLRRRVLELGNISILSGCRADELIADADGRAVTGVRFEDDDGRAGELLSSLVVEASSSGALTLAFLQSQGRAPPPDTVIGVDIGYASAVFVLPDDPARAWKMLMTSGQPPGDRRSAILLAMEGGRSMVTLVGRGDDRPPGDWDGYMAFAKSLASPTLFETIKVARRVGEVVRYRFAASVRRHFQEVMDFPDGLLPFGDAICRLNPAGGQGMTVAAQEARLLRNLLGDRAASGQELSGLAAEFFVGLKPVLDTPWGAIAAQDFRFPETRGERPANFETSTRFGAAMLRLAAHDAETHRLWQEVAHLLKPSSVYQDPDFVARVMAGPAA